MVEKSWFDVWFNSPFFHKLHSEKNDVQALALIPTLLKQISPAPGTRLLEVGCGTGNRSKIFASHGFEVTGIDGGEYNINVAKKHEGPKLEFFLHDIRLPAWGNYFSTAFNLFSQFGYFNTRREHDDAIRTIANSLQPGGSFVIDYLNVHYTEDHLLHEETKKIGSTTYNIRRWDDELYFYKKILVEDPSLKGGPLEFTEKMTKLTLGDFTDMLSFQSMQIEEVFGDYALGSYDIRKTARLIIHAKKMSTEPVDKEKRLYKDGRAGEK